MSNNKEKLPKLVDVYRSSNPLGKRQLPLVVDENLTLVMDVKGSGIVCDNPLIRGRELDEFTRKWEILSEKELNDALQITKPQLMNVLNQNVPCVGCRRSVERLYYQLFKLGHPTLDPLMVKSDGTITIRDEQQFMPQVLCSIFHDHSIRLAKLIENQPKRNKKSLRCLLHSLDSQRSRPLTPVWRDIWDCMKPDCKKDVCIIEAHTLLVTLETYLRKHRFCGECRTKVLKAYTLLMEDPEPCKEKGYVSSLYAGIKRCLPDKHIHLQMKTDYIIKLISRAEPELLGSRRERHAKTLEIAQEEVLTCLGICMYERLHRIYMRMREEECTCQVFAAVAVDTLSRSFETAVEHKQGISQLELLYAELAREEQQKQIKKEQKKIKRKRRKGGGILLNNGSDICANEKNLLLEDDEDDDDGKDSHHPHRTCTECDDDYYDDDEIDSSKDFVCFNCQEMLSTLKNNVLKCNNNNNNEECNGDGGGGESSREMWLEENVNCKCSSTSTTTATTKTKDNRRRNNRNKSTTQNVVGTNQGSNGSTTSTSSDHSHDCGYMSENNNGCCETGSLISSISSSPDGSELACSDICCQHDEYAAGQNNQHHVIRGGRYGQHHPSLEEMLEGTSDEDDDDNNCKLTPEEVYEFKTNHKHLVEKRQELREALKKKFIDFCAYGPLQVPRLLVQTKYASSN